MGRGRSRAGDLCGIVGLRKGFALFDILDHRLRLHANLHRLVDWKTAGFGGGLGRDGLRGAAPMLMAKR